MAVELAADRAGQRQRDQRHHAKGRQQRVRQQDREIDDADRTGARKMFRPGVRVIGEVGNEEQDRRRERREHHRAMLADATAPNQHVPDPEQHRRGRVQTRVQRG